MGYILPETDQGHLRSAAIAMYEYGCEINRPSYIHKPKLFIDRDRWCALYGDNLQDGVAGFGTSPEEACRDFDRNWTKDLSVTA